MLKRINDNAYYLDSMKWNYAPTAESVAYCQQVLLKYTSDTRTPYLSITFKDVNGLKVHGNLFDFNSDKYDGNILVMFRRKPVVVTYNVKATGGSYSLKVFDIKDYDGMFPYERFIGEVPNARERLAQINIRLNEITGHTLPDTFGTESYPGISEGKMGGLVDLSWSVYRGVTEYCAISRVDPKIFYTTMIKGLVYYAEYTKLLEHAASAPAFVLHKLKDELIGDTSDINLSSWIAELADAISLGVQPKSFPPVLVFKEMMHALQMYSAAYTYATMLEGSSTFISSGRGEDLLLEKY